MSGAKLCPKVILEGTRPRETALAFALSEHPGLVGPRRYRDDSCEGVADWLVPRDLLHGPPPA